MVAGPRARAAWRVFDAQYFGLAQRRKRVFVAVDFGNGADPVEVLFERQGLFGNTPPRREKREGVAPTLSARTKGGGGLGTDFDCDGGLIAAGIAPTLNAHFGDKQGLENQHIDGGRGTPIVPVAFAIQERAVSENPDAGPQGIGVQEGVSYTLEARHHVQAVAFAQNTRDEVRIFGEDGSTGGGALAAEPGMKQQCYVAQAFDLRGREGGAQFEGPHDTANIRAASGGSSRSYVAHQWAVRRLTPKECERLQGFSDFYTEAHGQADGPRYKQLGNSFAVPVVRWIGKRIDDALNKIPPRGSIK